MTDFSESYDYIVVGAGSAGAILANRLSADPNIRVCLLEAGPADKSIFIKIPLGIMQLMENPRFNWRFWTNKQAKAAGREIYIPRGKTLGGSSSINGMVYMRGHRTDYDDWAALGNTGWSYADVLPYFKRSENNEEHPDSPYHGAGGEMNVINLDSYNPLVDIMCEAGQSMQFPVTDDFNGAQQEGFGKRQFTIRKGKRESTATAFLHPVRNRKNLTVVTEAVVDRILFDGKKAVGVKARVAGQDRNIGVTREVILSGGTIASPLILMRSGIGPADELAKHGIDVLHELSGVGRNLQEHLALMMQHKSISTMPYGLSWKSLPWFVGTILKYPFTGTGLLANPILHAGGFMRSDPSLDRPDIQFILAPALRNPSSTVVFGHGYGIVVVVLRPKARGHVTLTGADADAPPHIDLDFLTDHDLELMLKSVKLGRRFFAAPAWDKVRGAEIVPGADVQTDDQIRDYIRRTCSTVFHPVGTCKMGVDEAAVVDPSLKVHGIEGVRVADASIMPTLIGGNTAAPSMMIGEKASDLVLGRPPLPAEPDL